MVCKDLPGVPVLLQHFCLQSYLFFLCSYTLVIYRLYQCSYSTLVSFVSVPLACEVALMLVLLGSLHVGMSACKKGGGMKLMDG